MVQCGAVVVQLVAVFLDCTKAQRQVPWGFDGVSAVGAA